MRENTLKQLFRVFVAALWLITANHCFIGYAAADTPLPCHHHAKSLAAEPSFKEGSSNDRSGSQLPAGRSIPGPHDGCKEQSCCSLLVGVKAVDSFNHHLLVSDSHLSLNILPVAQSGSGPLPSRDCVASSSSGDPPGLGGDSSKLIASLVISPNAPPSCG